jgi:cytoskeletal protein RodZ
MHNQPQRIKLNTLSKLGVIVLFIVLLTGISIVPTLQIGVQGRGQPHRSTPATSPTPTTPQSSTATTASTTPRPAPAPPTDTATTLRQTTNTPALDAVGEAANQTAGGVTVNQSDMVMIRQSSVVTMMSNLQAAMSNLQAAMNAVDNDNKGEATTALNSAEQQLKSAANAAGLSIENMTG